MKPLIVVSRCLGFDRCRYDGIMLHDDFIGRLKSHVEFITVCPELAIGLGVPRDPIRIIKQKTRLMLVQPATGRDVTDEMNAFAGGFIESLNAVDGFILKSRSPSCGIKDAHLFSNMEDQIPIGKTKGFFSKIICEHFPDLPVEDETSLQKRKIRDDFLKAIRVTLF